MSGFLFLYPDHSNTVLFIRRLIFLRLIILQRRPGNGLTVVQPLHNTQLSGTNQVELLTAQEIKKTRNIHQGVGLGSCPQRVLDVRPFIMLRPLHITLGHFRRNGHGCLSQGAPDLRIGRLRKSGYKSLNDERKIHGMMPSFWLSVVLHGLLVLWSNVTARNQEVNP